MDKWPLIHCDVVSPSFASNFVLFRLPKLHAPSVCQLGGPRVKRRAQVLPGHQPQRRGQVALRQVVGQEALHSQPQFR